MKINITKQIAKTETIEVELPYYFRHGNDFSNEIVYGKIEEKQLTEITVSSDGDGEEAYSIKREKFLKIDDQPFSFQFEEKYKLEEFLFLAIKRRALDFIYD